MSDFAAQLDEARRKLPLRTVITQAGKAPANDNWKSFPECPFCHEKGCSGVFRPQSWNSDGFHCHRTSCPSGGKTLDEIGWYEVHDGLSRDEAWKVYFKAAGVWRENRLSPSVMPGQSARKIRDPQFESENAQLVDECIEAIRTEGKASISFLQRRLRLGYTRAARIMDVLEERGIVGPSKGAEPRDILDLPPDLKNLPSAEASSASPLEAPAGDAEESASPSGLTVVPDDHHIVTGSSSEPPEPSLPATPSLSQPFNPPETEKSVADLDGGGKINPPPPPPAPPGSASSPEGDAPSRAVAALRWFYRRLQFVDSDRQLLWEKRGLTALTCAALGYRSNLKSNRDILLEMPEHFPMLVLMDSGLWQQSDRAADPPKPNAQYYGMSLAPQRDERGKKVRDEDGEPVVKAVFGDPGPILIPYFDEAGELVHLRPHKGMMRGRMPRFHVVRVAKEFLDAHHGHPLDVVGVSALPGITMAKPLFGDIEEWLEGLHAHYAAITEGEFKAAAIWQVMNGQAGAELPAVSQVIIGYDNEEKADPAFPGYQEDKWKRFDAEIWARFLARKLSKEGYDAKVARLPDAWRDTEGKADWDGHLAARLRELSFDTNDKWPYAHARLRTEFFDVFKSAVSIRELWQAQMFDSEEERIIKNRAHQIARTRSLAIGGEEEENIARRLHRLAPRLKRNDFPVPAANFLHLLAGHYGELRGRYYIFKKLSDKLADKWTGFKLKAEESSDTDLKRACEIVLEGIPQYISDFHLMPHNVVVLPTGKKTRTVTLKNVHGETYRGLELPAASYAMPSKFREWLAEYVSQATWLAGEREFQKMQEDICHDLAFKEITEVAVRGYHPPSKCWFYGDVVYAPDGQEFFTNKDGVVWIKSDGGLSSAYKLSKMDQEGQKFCHDTPMMHPRRQISDLELRQFFMDTLDKLDLTIGDYSGMMAFGCMLACGAGPEIYKQENGFPCLWVHGETRQGKSSFSRWMLKIWGFNKDGGMPLADSTKAGISIALQQYGELVVWLEEFQPGAPDWMIQKIKNIFNRESGIKKTFDEVVRSIVSTVIVTGVATCSDPQTKSRFAHVQVASKNRKEDTYAWFQEHSGKFFLFGRHIMRNRPQFAKRAAEIVKEWMEEDMPGLDGRAKLVHGACYAGLLAFNELVGSPLTAGMIAGYKAFLVEHAVDSVRAVDSQVIVNKFWQDVLDALGSQAFGHTYEERRQVFRFVENPSAPSPASEHQTARGGLYPQYAWKSGKLYFRPSLLLDMLRQHKRRLGDNGPMLEQGDLQTQMKTRPYWVPGGKRGHYQLFGYGAKSKEFCWCIDLDQHPMGFRAVDDDDFETSLLKESGGPDEWMPTEDWVDPRQGELYRLVHSLKKREAKGDSKII